MRADRDLADAIYREIASPRAIDYALELWRESLGLLVERDRFDLLLPVFARYIIDRVLTRQLREAARTGPWGEPEAAQYERMQDALERIVSWSEAYPLDIFPEPDLEKARELLEAGGITLDAVSAHCIRHVIDGVGKIARNASERLIVT